MSLKEERGRKKEESGATQSNVLPASWAKTTLDAVVNVMDFEREPINASERNDRINGKPLHDLYPYYGATGQVGLIDAFRSEGERVLLGEDAAPFLDPSKAKAYLANGRFWVNNHAHVLSGADGVMNNRFLCHQLNIVDYHPYVTGSTRLKLTSSAMRKISLVVAPIAEQTRIVEKLEELLAELDAGVAELKVAQKKLAQYRQSLLKAAVEGQLTANWRVQHPPAETGAELLSRILKERRARWEAKQLEKFASQGKTPPKNWQSKYPEPAPPDTQNLPRLPEGWVWASLDALTFDGPQNGLYLPASKYGQGTPILRIDDYQIGWNREISSLNCVKASSNEIKTYALASGDIVINRVNSMTHLGKSLLVSNQLNGALFESNMMRLRLSETISGKFVVFYLGSDIGRARLVQDAKWAVNQASINQQDVRKTIIPLMPEAEQLKIEQILVEQLCSITEQEAAISHALKQSTAQRQNILRAAFAGELAPQDSNDEPASVLLARIRAQRAAQTPTKKPRGRKKKEAS